MPAIFTERSAVALAFATVLLMSLRSLTLRSGIRLERMLTSPARSGRPSRPSQLSELFSQFPLDIDGLEALFDELLEVVRKAVGAVLPHAAAVETDAVHLVLQVLELPESEPLSRSAAQAADLDDDHAHDVPRPRPPTSTTTMPTTRPALRSRKSVGSNTDCS